MSCRVLLLAALLCSLHRPVDVHAGAGEHAQERAGASQHAEHTAKCGRVGWNAVAVLLTSPCNAAAGYDCPREAWEMMMMVMMIKIIIVTSMARAPRDAGEGGREGGRQAWRERKGG